MQPASLSSTGSQAFYATSTLRVSLAVPMMIAGAGDRASKRFLDFFVASIDNDNTATAYYRAVCNFFAWLEQHGIRELVDIEPFHVAAYLKALKVSERSKGSVKERDAANPIKKQHLAAIRMLFDWLIVGQVIAINPAHAVRGPKHVVSRGKTPVLSEDEARQFLASIKITKKVKLADGSEEERPWLVGLCDRALLAVMTYSFARISAVVGMKVEDYFPNGKRWWVRLYEKGGKVHEMPAHHKLEHYLDEYLAAAGYPGSGEVSPFPLDSRESWAIDRPGYASCRRLPNGRAFEPAHDEAVRSARRWGHTRRGRADQYLNMIPLHAQCGGRA